VEPLLADIPGMANSLFIKDVPNATSNNSVRCSSVVLAMSGNYAVSGLQNREISAEGV